MKKADVYQQLATSQSHIVLNGDAGESILN